MAANYRTRWPLFIGLAGRILSEQVAAFSGIRKTLLKAKEEELKALEYGLDRVQDLYVIGSIDRQQLKVRLERQRSLIQQKRNEIEELRVSIGGYDSIPNDERLRRVEELKRTWDTLEIETKERNRLARRIIEKIIYKRKGTNTDIQVQFL